MPPNQMRRAGLTRRNPPRMREPVWAGMARKKSSYRLSSRLNSSAKARRNYITYLNSGGNPKANAEREVTMLFAQQSASGYVGYSSFEDDKFGDLRGPQPIPDNPLLALMKLPGGGDYGVFGGNAVSRLKKAEIVVGDTTAKPALADTLTYTAGNDRTAVFFAEDQLVMEPETEYPFTVRGIPAVRLTAAFSGGGEMHAALVEAVALAAVFAAGGDLNARMCIEHRLKASHDGGGAMRAHIYPPLTLRGSPDLGGGMVANMQLVQTLRATMSLGGNLQGSLTPAVALVGRMALGGAMRGRIVPAVKLRGVMALGGELVGNIALPPPVVYDPSTEAIIAAMAVAPDAGRAVAMDDMVLALKDAGIWVKLTDLYVFHAHDEQAARVNWRNPTRNATKRGSPVFTPDFSYAGVVNADHGLVSAFVPATDGAGIYQQNNASIFAYIEGAGDDYNFIGIAGVAAMNIRRGTNVLNGSLNGPNASIPCDLTSVTTGALVAVTRTVSTHVRGFINGVQQGGDYASTSSALGTQPFGLLCRYIGPTVSGSGNPLRASGWGAALTAAEQTTLKNILETFYAAD